MVMRKMDAEAMKPEIQRLVDECEDVQDALQYAEDIQVDFPLADIADIRSAIELAFENQ